MTRLWLSMALVLGGLGAAWGAVQGEEVTYRANDTVMRGYLAYDDDVKGRRPGVLVVHEWWGHNEYARKRARMLAELGYTALAVDMYGDGKQARHPEDAGKFSSAVMQNLSVARKRFDAARALLESHETTDADRTAAIGYCFGGGVVLHMARAGEDLRGVVSFHGSLATARPAPKDGIKARILVLTGADDPFVPAQQVEDFRNEMEAAGADYKVISYPGAKHSFTNPEADAFGGKFNLPLAYHAEADKRSWKAMQAFFERIF